MRRMVPWVVLAVMLSGCAVLRAPLRKSVAVTVSVGCATADLTTSLRAFERGAVEANPLLRGEGFTARKMALEAGVVGAGLLLWEERPWMGRVLLYGNGAVKCVIAGRNHQVMR